MSISTIRNLPPSQGGKYAGFGNPDFQSAPKPASGDVYDSLATVVGLFHLFRNNAIQAFFVRDGQCLLLGHQSWQPRLQKVPLNLVK